MHVNLTPKLDEYILGKVKSGRYNNASEVVREALRRMQDEEGRQYAAAPDLTAEEVDGIRSSIQQAIAEIERGEGQFYKGKSGLKRLFGEVRAQALKELSAERLPKKAKR